MKSDSDTLYWEAGEFQISIPFFSAGMTLLAGLLVWSVMR